jgi:hypothetical protein
MGKDSYKVKNQNCRNVIIKMNNLFMLMEFPVLPGNTFLVFAVSNITVFFQTNFIKAKLLIREYALKH